MSLDEKKVTIKMIMWIIGTLVTVWGGAYGYTWVRLDRTEVKAENVGQQYIGVNTSLGKIQTDIDWIKKTLEGKYK